MKKSAVILMTFVWLVVVAAAYYLGRQQGVPASGTPDEASTAQTTSPVGKASPPGETASAPASSEASTTTPLPSSAGTGSIDALLAAGTPVSAEALTSAIQDAFNEKDPVESNLMFAKLLSLITPENAPAALEAMSEQPRSFSSYYQQSLFQFAWGQKDGPAAATYAMEKEGRSREYTISTVMSGWGSTNPDEALAWVEQIEDPKERGRFTGGIIRGLAKTDPARATTIAIAAAAEDDGRARDYIEDIAREQFRGGVRSATAWVSSVPLENGLREEALEQVAQSYVDRSPEEAAAWIKQYAGSGYAERAIGEVAEEWAERDPAAAIDWIGSLPPGDERQRAYREAVYEWTERDPFSAAEYLVDMNAGEDRDAAITALSRRHLNQDPEAALTWAQSIGDAELRISTVTATGQQWMRRDPEGASTWLAASGLPAEIQQKIANPPKPANNSRDRR